VRRRAVLVVLIVFALVLPGGAGTSGAQTGDNRCTDASNRRQQAATAGGTFNGDTYVYQSTFNYYTHSSFPEANIDQNTITARFATTLGADSWDGYRTNCTGTLPDGGVGWSAFQHQGSFANNPLATGDSTNMAGWVNFTNIPAGTPVICRDFLASQTTAFAAVCLYTADPDGNATNDTAYLWEYGVAFNYNSTTYLNGSFTTNMSRTTAPWRHIQATAAHEWGHVIGLAHPAGGTSARMTMDAPTADGAAQRDRYWLGNGDMWGAWDRKP